MDRRQKKITLVIGLLSLTLVLSYTLGKLDFFGFLSGRHALNFILLVSSFLLWHLISIVVFLLDLDRSQHRERVYLAVGSIFGVLFFTINQDILISLLSTFFFFFFLLYTNRALQDREKLFVKFAPKEILFPVIRSGFIFLLIMLAIMGYWQTLERAKKTNLLSPDILKLLSRPGVVIVNRQLGAQLQTQLGDRFQEAIGTSEKKAIVEFVLSESLETMSEGQTRQLFGLRADNIPVDRTVVYDNGEVDVMPVVEAVLPRVSDNLNQLAKEHLILAPVVIAVLILLIVSPLLTLTEFVLFLPTAFVIWLLLRTKFLEMTTTTVEKEVLKL